MEIILLTFVAGAVAAVIVWTLAASFVALVGASRLLWFGRHGRKLRGASPVPPAQSGHKFLDPFVIIEGIRRDGLTADGSDLNDLTSIIETIVAEREEMRGKHQRACLRIRELEVGMSQR